MCGLGRSPLRLPYATSFGGGLSSISTSQCTVQQKLDKFLRDFQNGGREGSVVSGQTAESLAPDQVATWRAIRKELEEIGITVAAFDSNREFIFTWFMRSVESGAFEEQGGEDSQSVAVPERLPSSPPDVPGPPSAQSDTSQTALHLTGIESDVAHHVPVGGGIDLPITVSRASTSGSPSPSASTNPDVRASNHSNRLSPAQRKRPVPRVVALFSKLYSPERSFRRSIKEDDPLRRILEDFPGLVEGDSRKELKRAIENVETETIHMLLQYEFDADQTTSCDGMSLLAFASYHRQSGFVRFLWDNGADVNASTSRFLYPTALLAASAWGRQEIVQLLLDKGADVNVQGGDDGTALQAASSHGHREIVQSLLDKGADVNAQGGRYGTALQAASAWRRPGIVQLLLDNGANVNAQGGRHGTALQAASTRGYREIVQLLRENGAR